jgi:hydroxymethylglutaryl-CoA lyase
LQNQTGLIVPTQVKIEFIRHLAAAGHRHIEVGAFVRPDKVPQMADSEEVFAELADLAEQGVRLAGLVPNMRGFERGADKPAFTEVAVFTAATDAFNLRNIGTTIEGAFERFEPVFAAAKERETPVRGYVSVAFGTPDGRRCDAAYAARVAEISTRLVEMGAYEVSVGDTVGVGTVAEVQLVLDALLPALGAERVSLHLHDTRGQALANIMAALARGIRSFDASSGGLGGCPFAPRSTGNVATEEVLVLLAGLGYETDIDLDAQMQASWFIEGFLGRALPSRTLAAARSGDQ